ncbi:hypothetical protein [Holospora undulata]|nr:hypothetical protein [Holospora undulata]
MLQIVFFRGDHGITPVFFELSPPFHRQAPHLSPHEAINASAPSKLSSVR